MSRDNYHNHCATCKYFAQGETCSYCEHPKASENEKSYRYYVHNCDDQNKNKWESGISQTRIDYMNWNLPWQKQKIKL